MPHRVVLTEEAERNLVEIGDFIALDNPTAARETIVVYVLTSPPSLNSLDVIVSGAVLDETVG